MVRSLLAAIVAVAVWGTPGEAQVKLERKYVEGSKFASQSEAKTVQVLTIAGMAFETDSKQFSITQGSVGQRSAEGDLPIVSKIENMQIDLALPGGIKLAFASTDPDKKADIPELQKLLDYWRAASKATWTMVLDRNNEVKSVDEKQDLIDAVGEEYKSQLSSDYRKKLLRQEFARLPDKPVSKGDTWERTAEYDLGGGQILTLQKRYEYAGTVEKDGKTYDKIVAVTTAVTYAMDPNAKSPLKVTGSELKPTESSSEILFNRAEGYVAESQDKVRIEGSLKLTINGMELPGKLDLTIGSKGTEQPR
jgi:hypothetical protein